MPPCAAGRRHGSYLLDSLAISSRSLRDGRYSASRFVLDASLTVFLLSWSYERVRLRWPTRWHATQRSAWELLDKAEDAGPSNIVP